MYTYKCLGQPFAEPNTGFRELGRHNNGNEMYMMGGALSVEVEARLPAERRNGGCDEGRGSRLDARSNYPALMRAGEDGGVAVASSTGAAAAERFRSS